MAFGESYEQPRISHREAKEFKNEAAIEKAAREFRDFVKYEVPFLNREKIEAIPTERLPELLHAYWDTPASVEHFRALLRSFGDSESGSSATFDLQGMLDQKKSLGEQFAKYILGKLPLEQQERFEEKFDEANDRPSYLRTLQAAIKAASQPNNGLIVGYHTSTRDIDQNPPGNQRDLILPAKTSDTFHYPGGDQTRTEESAKTFFSTDRTHLYRGGMNPKYLYIVEASRSILNDKEKNYAPSQGAYYVHGPLRVRHKIPLIDASGADVSKEVLAILGMKFADFTKRAEKKSTEASVLPRTSVPGSSSLESAPPA